MIGVAHRLLRELTLGTISAVRPPYLEGSGELGDLERAARFFHEHGWLLVRNFLNSDEVEEMIDSLRRATERKATGDVLLIDGLGHMATDGRLVRLVRALIGKRVAWYGDASWSFAGDGVPDCGFHKDNADKDDPRAPDWQGDYPLLRAGFYFKDYSCCSGGLGLRDRSHKLPSCLDGIPFAVPSRPGDLLLWSLRTTHSGFVSRPRWPQRMFVPLPVQSRVNFPSAQFKPLPVFQSAPGDSTRPTMFLTYGAPGAALDRYLTYLSTRCFAVRTWQATRYPEGTRERLAEKGLELIDMPSRVKALRVNDLNEYHAPLPY